MNYRIEVAEEELGLIARALVEMPYKNVAQLLDKLNAQITEQQKSQAEDAPQEDALPAE